MTETWLNERILNSEILSNKYNIFRRDRVSNGGGVLIAVSNTFSCQLLDLDSSLDIEFIAVEVKNNLKKMFITCSYIPPSSPQIIYEKHSHALKAVLQKTKPEDLICILGDFNIPNMLWNFLPGDKYLLPENIHKFYELFFDTLFDLGIFQINCIRNTYNKLLDLIFVNQVDECYIQRIDPLTFPEDQHHPTIKINVSFPTGNQIIPVTQSEKSLCFSKTNFEQLRELMHNTDWNILLSSTYD